MADGAVHFGEGHVFVYEERDGQPYNQRDEIENGVNAEPGKQKVPVAVELDLVPATAQSKPV